MLSIFFNVNAMRMYVCFRDNFINFKALFPVVGTDFS